MIPAGRLTVQVARSAVELDKLEIPWDELLDAVPGCSLSQTFRYARAAWTRIAEPRRSRLAVVSVWRDDELLVVWPLHVETRRCHTLATHLGNTSTQEYASPVVRPGEHAQEALAKALAEATRLADVLAVYHVPGSPLPFEGRPLLGGLALTTSTKAPLARRPDAGGFEAWLEARSQKLRWEMRRNRRRLEAAGAVAFVSSDSDATVGHGAIDWIFQRKREWLRRRRRTTPWISDSAGEAFFHELLDRTPDGAPLRPLVVGLTLDGEFVSASVCYRSGRAIEGFIMAFDESRSSLGPGNVLIEECVRLAFELGLDFDFRVDLFDYKLRWADDATTYHTQFVPCTVRGAPPVAQRRVSHACWELKRVSTPVLGRYVPTAVRARARREPLVCIAAALVHDCRALMRRLRRSRRRHAERARAANPRRSTAATRGRADSTTARPKRSSP